MNDPPRRRRSSGYTPGERKRDGGFPLWPLLIVIVVLGFFIGGVLARFLGAPHIAMNQKTVQPTPLPTIQFTPAPTATAQPEPTQPPTPSPLPTLSPSPLPRHTTAPKAAAVAPPAAPTVPPTPEPTQAPATAAPSPLATSSPALRQTEPIARKPAPEQTAPPPAPTAADTSGSVVRSYIDALANGNRSSAQQYLASGSVDQDSFIDGSAQITGLRTSHNADGSSKVDVDLNTASGKYSMSFTVNGSRITDHTAVKS